MSNPIRRIFCIILFIAAFTGCVTSTGEESYAVVKWVADGDTIQLSDGRFVRYLGIDTPELHHPRRSITPEYLAQEAKEYNNRLVLGKRVRLEFDIEKQDKYNRLLAYVFVGNTFVNAKLIEEGYARLFIIAPNTKYAEEFLKLEEQAKRAKKGIWAD